MLIVVTLLILRAVLIFVLILVGVLVALLILVVVLHDKISLRFRFVDESDFRRLTVIIKLNTGILFTRVSNIKLIAEFYRIDNVSYVIYQSSDEYKAYSESNNRGVFNYPFYV